MHVVDRLLCFLDNANMQSGPQLHSNRSPSAGVGRSISVLCVPDRWVKGGGRGGRSCRRAQAQFPLSALWYTSKHQTEAEIGANNRASSGHSVPVSIGNNAQIFLRAMKDISASLCQPGEGSLVPLNASPSCIFSNAYIAGQLARVMSAANFGSGL